MKKFRAKTNISQLVFLILWLVLAFQTVYLTLQGIETALFNNVLLVVIWYYYGKSTADKPDTLVEWDLDDNNKI